MNLLKIFLFTSIIANSTALEIKSQTGNEYIKWLVDSKGKKISKSEYKKFDDKDNLIKWIQYVDNLVLVDSFSYIYESGLEKEEKKFTENGQLFSTTIFEYNSNRKKETTKTFDNTNNLESYTKHKLFENMEIVESYESNSEIFSIDTLVYDNRNHVLSEIQYLPDGTWFQKHFFKYDAKGNLIKMQEEANPEFDGVGIVEYNYEYNNKNKPIKETVNLPDNSVEYYIYEYSSK